MILPTKNPLGAFPLKLYEMLEDAEQHDFEHIISWISNGTGFRVHKPDELVEQILPKYFNQQTRYKSFQRQMNMYEFKMLRKAAKGSYEEQFKGAIFHPLFVRGKKELCAMIMRKSVPRDDFHLTAAKGKNLTSKDVVSLKHSFCFSSAMISGTIVTPGGSALPHCSSISKNTFPVNTRNSEGSSLAIDNFFPVDFSSCMPASNMNKSYYGCQIQHMGNKKSSIPNNFSRQQVEKYYSAGGFDGGGHEKGKASMPDYDVGLYYQKQVQSRQQHPAVSSFCNQKDARGARTKIAWVKGTKQEQQGEVEEKKAFAAVLTDVYAQEECNGTSWNHIESASWYKQHSDCLLDYATTITNSRFQLQKKEQQWAPQTSVEVKPSRSGENEGEKTDLYGSSMHWCGFGTHEDDITESIISVFGQAGIDYGNKGVHRLD